MKIKHIKCAVSILAGATIFSLTKFNCLHVNSKFEPFFVFLDNANAKINLALSTLQLDSTGLDIALTSLENLEDVQNQHAKLLEHVEKVTETAQLGDTYFYKNLINSISEQLNEGAFEYFEKDGIYTISMSSVNVIQKELPEGFYSNLNLLLSREVPYCLQLKFFNNEIDISKLNLTNVKYLELFSCGRELNYEAFSNHLYNSIIFDNIVSENAIKVLPNATNVLTEIRYDNNYDSDNFKFIEFLAENNVPMKSIYYSSNEKQNDTKMYNLLGSLNANNISYFEYSTKQNTLASELDLDFVLDDKVEYFSATFARPMELKDIHVTSQSSNVTLRFNNIQITEKSNFTVPDESYIVLNGTCSDSSAFYDLDNIYQLNYYDSSNDDSFIWDSYTATNSFHEAIEKFQESRQENLIKK